MKKIIIALFFVLGNHYSMQAPEGVGSGNYPNASLESFYDVTLDSGVTQLGQIDQAIKAVLDSTSAAHWPRQIALYVNNGVSMVITDYSYLIKENGKYVVKSINGSTITTNDFVTAERTNDVKVSEGDQTFLSNIAKDYDSKNNGKPLFVKILPNTATHLRDAIQSFQTPDSSSALTTLNLYGYTGFVLRKNELFLPIFIK